VLKIRKNSIPDTATFIGIKKNSGITLKGMLDKNNLTITPVYYAIGSGHEKNKPVPQSEILKS
jgi:hypothetical protein